MLYIYINVVSLSISIGYDWFVYMTVTFKYTSFTRGERFFCTRSRNYRYCIYLLSQLSPYFSSVLHMFVFTVLNVRDCIACDLVGKNDLYVQLRLGTVTQKTAVKVESGDKADFNQLFKLYDLIYLYYCVLW